MTTQLIENVTERISLFISDNYAEPRWVEIDTTGAAPETVNGFERATGTDAAVPIYRSPALTRSRYAMLEELVKISSGIAPAEGAHRQQMLELRNRLEAAEADHRRVRKIIEQARRWKQRSLAAEAEADTLHAVITSAELRARTAERDRDTIEAKLDRALVDASRAHTLRREAQAERLDAEARISDAQAKALSTIEKIASLIPAPEAAELPPFGVSSYYGTDNVPVVEIDTQLIEGRLRVSLDGAPIWDGEPETDERPGANAEQRAWEAATTRSERELTGTISRQLETIRDCDARIEELEDEQAEARNELAATRRELDSTAESLSLSEQHFEKAVALSERRQERVEELLAERDKLRAERDELTKKHANADDMRKRLDERLAEERRAHEVTGAGLRAMICQRDNVLRASRDLADRVTDGGTGGPSSGDLLAATNIRESIGTLPKLDDEGTARADGGVLEMLRAVERVVRFWRAAPTSVVTEQLNIALAELANHANRAKR